MALRTTSIGDFGKKDVNFGKYFKAVQRVGKLVLHRVLLDLFSSETTDHTLSLEHFCLSKLGWTKTRLRSTFKSDLPKLDFSISGDTLDGDVSFCYKVTQEVFPNIPETLVEKLRELKNCRNILCHEETVIDDNALHDKIEQLKSLSTSILQEISSVTQKSTKDLSDLIIVELNKLLDSSTSSSPDISNYKNFLQDTLTTFIRHGRRELRSAYSHLKILNPCCWLSDGMFDEFTVENVFTVLKLSHTLREVEIQNLLQIKESRFVASLILLCGLAGSGKSSLTRYLIDQWCCHSDKVTDLKNLDLLIFVSMGKATCCSLQMYIQQELMPLTTKHIHPDEIVSLMMNMNLLFIIDGYDEGNANTKQLVKEIVTKFPFSKIIITSRPEFIVELKLLSGNHVLINVVGFDDKSIKSYAEKVLATSRFQKQNHNNALPRFLKYLSDIGECLGDSLYLPMTVALLLVLWNHNQDTVDINTATKLYEEIFKLCKMKLVWRLKDKTHSHQLKVEADVEKWFEGLCHTAWDMLLTDSLALSNTQSKTLMTRASDMQMDEVQTMSTFLNCEITESFFGPSYSFSFLHNSVQEFLAATYFAVRIQNAQMSGSDLSEALPNVAALKKCNPSRLRGAMVHCIGLLRKEGDIPVPVVEYLIKTCLVNYSHVLETDILLWHKVILESVDDPAVCQVVNEVIGANVSWTITPEVDHRIMEAQLKILKSTMCSPSRLLVDIGYDKDVTSVPHLEEVVQLCAVGKKTMMQIYLHRQYNETASTDTMDAFIAPLLQANLVLELKGHGGRQVLRALKNAVSLQSLYLRISTGDSMNFLSYLQLSDTFVLANIIRFQRDLKRRIENRNNSRGLTFFELFIDIKPSDIPSRISRLKYDGKLILKFSEVSDNDIDGYSRVIGDLHHNYSSIILLNSNISLHAVKKLVKKSAPARIKEIQVHSMQELKVEEDSQNVDLHARQVSTGYKTVIRWSSLTTSSTITHLLQV